MIFSSLFFSYTIHLPNRDNQQLFKREKHTPPVAEPLLCTQISKAKVVSYDNMCADKSSLHRDNAFNVNEQNKIHFENHDNDPANKTNMMLAAMLERYSVKFCGDDGDAADARRSVVAPEALSFLRRSSQRPVTV